MSTKNFMELYNFPEYEEIPEESEASSPENSSSSDTLSPELKELYENDPGNVFGYLGEETPQKKADNARYAKVLKQLFFAPIIDGVYIDPSARYGILKIRKEQLETAKAAKKEQMIFLTQENGITWAEVVATHNAAKERHDKAVAKLPYERIIDDKTRPEYWLEALKDASQNYSETRKLEMRGELQKIKKTEQELAEMHGLVDKMLDELRDGKLNNINKKGPKPDATEMTEEELQNLGIVFPTLPVHPPPVPPKKPFSDNPLLRLVRKAYARWMAHYPMPIPWNFRVIDKKDPAQVAVETLRDHVWDKAVKSVETKLQTKDYPSLLATLEDPVDDLPLPAEWWDWWKGYANTGGVPSMHPTKRKRGRRRIHHDEDSDTDSDYNPSDDDDDDDPDNIEYAPVKKRRRAEKIAASGEISSKNKTYDKIKSFMSFLPFF